ncbi:elongin-B-like [Rhopilema esculentum]|uniref:elongin-B-like n=1 Tax=Rhopilema esculentum TaxID=499914 RepID=UPI0031D1097C
MEVFIIVKRKNLTMFLDGKMTTTVFEVKKMIQGITKKLPEDQRLLLLQENREMEDNKTLADYGLTSQVAKAQTPALLAVTYKNEDGQFEEVDFTPLSQPPDPPEALKQPDSSIMSQHKS